MPKAYRSVLIAIVLALAACSGELKPVDIENGDMCSFCRMAISEKRFAAEMITDEGTALKFDDIGCMLRYRKADGGKTKTAAIFVASSENAGWLKAENARFARSSTVKTPMGSGIIAFDSAEAAGQGAMTFAELEK